MASTELRNKRQFENSLKTRLGITPENIATDPGAPLLNVPYEEQVAAKTELVYELFSTLPVFKGLGTYQISQSPQQFHYRVKMDFVINDQQIGLHNPRDYRSVIELDQVSLFDPVNYSWVKSIFAASQKLGIAGFNLQNKIGELRYLSVKRTNATHSMLTIITATAAPENQINELAKLALEIGFLGVNWLISPPEQDLTFGTPAKVFGASTIPMTIGSLTFPVGINTFTQNNIPGFELILKYVTPFVYADQPILDLYCGIGTIGLQFVAETPLLVGVDEVADSINSARATADRYGFTNATFITNRVADFLYDENHRNFSYYKYSDLGSRYEMENQHFKTIIVDPARPGLGNKAAKRLWKYFDADRIIYISCNPLSQFDDLAQLLTHYQPIAWQGFDLFPHTNHLENVIILDRVKR